jgi:hypothetical protein
VLVAQKFFIALSLASTLPAVCASEFLDRTYFIDLSQGSQLSQTMRAAENGGFETSGGGSVRFKDWYSTNWTDTRFTMMTQLAPWLGIVWGASTGEYGQKYVIDPSLKVGLIVLGEIDKNASISFKATAIIGGSLREKSCIADYGEIGGVQKVNCRLAASTLAPNDTLQYLYNMSPVNTYFFRSNTDCFFSLIFCQ